MARTVVEQRAALFMLKCIHSAAPLALRLPLTTQLDFEPLHLPVGTPHHRDTNRREELNGWGRRLLVHVCRCMDRWVSFCDRESPDRALMAELWRVFQPQPSEPALPVARRRGLFCQR